MASQVGVRQSARTFELQRRKFALMAAEHVQALGERIRLRREELGMTQDEVARAMQGSVDGQRISKWERGENRPRDESLEDLARVLKTTPAALLIPLTEKGATPDLSSPAQDDDSVMRRVEDLLKQQNELLARQSDILDRIEKNIANEQQATKDAEAARQSLLEAAGVASRAYEDAARRLAEARGTQAT